MATLKPEPEPVSVEPAANGRTLWLGKVVDSGGGMAHLMLHRDTMVYPDEGADVAMLTGVEDWRELLNPDMAVTVAQESMRRVQEQNVQLQAQLEQAAGAINRVTDLHEPRHRTREGWTERWCGECGTDWPCKTVRAMGDLLGLDPEPTSDPL